MLAVFPHPDDEAWAAGGLLQRAGEAQLVTLTRGEAGRDHVGGLTGAALAARRTDELAAACDALGVRPPFLLDLPDGGVDARLAAAALVPLLTDFAPDVVVGFDRDGGYGHLDHVAGAAATRDAVNLADSRACVLGCAFPPDLLAPLRDAFARRRPELVHPDYASGDLGSERADLVLDLTSEEGRRKRRALAAHASQMRRSGDAGPDGFLGRGVFQRLCRQERFVVLAGQPWW